MLRTIAAAAMAAAFSVPVMAQECAPIDQVGDYLAREFGEVPLISGMVDSTRQVFIFVNPKTKTFTIVDVVNGCAADGPVTGIDWLRIGRQI